MSRRLVEPLAAALFAVGLGCASNYGPAAAPAPPGAAGEVTRFRLLLSDNPVNPGDAFRCHGQCQARDTPEGYLQCLSECPGFEQTPGATCAPNEVPPLAACFTARPAPVGSEPRAGSVVVAVVADIPLVVGVAAVCASQTEPCGYGGGLVP
jgi:hypothetical protein